MTSEAQSNIHGRAQFDTRHRAALKRVTIDPHGSQPLLRSTVFQYADLEKHFVVTAERLRKCFYFSFFFFMSVG